MAFFFFTCLEKHPPEIIKADIENLFLEINRQMSIYQENSEISQFNQAKTLELFKISDDFAVVVKEAIRIAQFTQGSLDITLAPIIDLWGFGASNHSVTISEIEINNYLPYLGVDKINLFHQDNRYYLNKTHPNVSIDLCAIAKGFGVDKVADYLELQGISHYLVDIGGELRCKGINTNNQSWCIGIEKPDNSQEIFAKVQLKNKALATSANYRNFYKNDKGEHICHIIDPQTYKSTQSDIYSLSVITDSCMTADGLATALLAFGKDKALAFAEDYNLAVYLITLEANGMFKAYSSSVFEQYFAHL